MSTHRVTRTQPIERVSLRPPTVDNVGSAWSTSCARCSAKVSRGQVRRISICGSALNVCPGCKDEYTARKAVSA